MYLSAMRSASYSQTTLTVSAAGRVRAQSPSPSRCRTSSHGRGRSGVQATAVELRTDLHQVQADEKEHLKELNVCFAGYIEKVHALERRNTALKAQLADLQARYTGPPGPEYELQFKELKDLIEAMTKEKGAADIERGYIEEDIEMWRLKLEEELTLKGNVQLYEYTFFFCYEILSSF